ncbi:MAG: Na/Pi symporter, partial [Planctomycetia bacterium]|nr:Na/Pi symporter [Planctomycetia bacterium]
MSTVGDASARPSASVPPSRGAVVMRALLFFFLVYLFLVAISMFGDSTKMLTNEYREVWELLTDGLENPFVGLCLGIFATALMQSSSATTSLAVAMVASGTIDLRGAVTIVMGANIGTSLTCMLVSLGHIGQKKAFARAFSAALIQDN